MCIYTIHLIGKQSYLFIGYFNGRCFGYFGCRFVFFSEWTVAVLVCTIKNMRCEVMTIQNYCYALVSCQIFLLTDHAVGTG